MKSKAISIKDFDFTPYGRYFNLKSEREVTTDWYKAYMTNDQPIKMPMRFGITECAGLVPFTVKSMERHLSTEEILFAGDKPIVLSVADSDPKGVPRTEDIVSLIMEPGDLVVMNRGIWHDACHAVYNDARYYFLSKKQWRSI